MRIFVLDMTSRLLVVITIVKMVVAEQTLCAINKHGIRVGCHKDHRIENLRGLAEKNPDDVWDTAIHGEFNDMITGDPVHWVYTKNVLNMLIARYQWNGDDRYDIPYVDYESYDCKAAANYASCISNRLNSDMNLGICIESAKRYYRDMSWGIFEINATIAPDVWRVRNHDVNSTGLDASDVMLDFDEIAKQNGYATCGGICGSPRASNPDGEFDLIAAIFRADPPTFTEDFFALGALSGEKAWMKYPTSEDALQHEIGHNFGIEHGATAKLRYGENVFNTVRYEGFSRVSGGGRYRIDEESTRYEDNGHFGIASKHWFGWLADEQIVFMHPEGPTSNCPKCVREWSGRINAYDRPDVIPGRALSVSGSKTFGVKVQYPHPHGVLYIYYRSAYNATDGGASVQFCNRAWTSYGAGQNSMCYTYDAHGDTATMADSVILPGETYVAAPPLAGLNFANERFQEPNPSNLLRTLALLPVVTVTDAPSWDDCVGRVCPGRCDITVSERTKGEEEDRVAIEPTSQRECEVGGGAWVSTKDISIGVSIRFQAPGDKPVHPDLKVTSLENMVSAEITTRAYSTGSDLAFIQLSGSDTLVARTRGTVALSWCPSSKVTAYFYDVYPFAALVYGQDPGLGASIAVPLYPGACCDPHQLTVGLSGIMAIAIRQMDSEPLSIAIFEIYTVSGGEVDQAPTLCTTGGTYPAGGTWYETNGRDNWLDGNINTFSHSGNPNEAGRSFDICVFETPVAFDDLWKVRVVSRKGWAQRNLNYQVEFYGGAEYSEAGLHGKFLLHHDTILNEMMYELPVNDPDWAKNRTVPCNEDMEQGPSQAFNYPLEGGNTYVILAPSAQESSATVFITAEVDVTCDSSTSVTETSVRVSERFEPAAAFCHTCPEESHLYPVFTLSIPSSHSADDWMHQCPGSHGCDVITLALEGEALMAFEKQPDGTYSHANSLVMYPASWGDAWVLDNDLDEIYGVLGIYLPGDDARNYSHVIEVNAADIPVLKDLSDDEYTVSTAGLVKAVVVTQQSPSPAILSLCEMEAYGVAPADGRPAENLLLADGVTCFSIGAQGWRYSANRSNAADPFLNDGIVGDESNGRCASAGSPFEIGDAFVCVLPEPKVVMSVVLHANCWYSESARNVDIELFAEADNAATVSDWRASFKTYGGSSVARRSVDAHAEPCEEGMTFHFGAQPHCILNMEPPPQSPCPALNVSEAKEYFEMPNGVYVVCKDRFRGGGTWTCASEGMWIGPPCIEVVPCLANEYVSSNLCKSCPAGMSSTAGSDPSGFDTTCSEMCGHIKRHHCSKDKACTWVTTDSQSACFPMVCSDHVKKKKCRPDDGCLWTGGKCGIFEGCTTLSKKYSCRAAKCAWKEKTKSCIEKNA